MEERQLHVDAKKDVLHHKTGPPLKQVPREAGGALSLEILIKLDFATVCGS